MPCQQSFGSLSPGRLRHRWVAEKKQNMTSLGNRLLQLGGTLSFLIALLHVLIVIIGIPAYRFFGGVGDDLADLVVIGSLLPVLITLAIALVFCVFGCYAFSGAGILSPWPWLRWGLITIGSVYLLRGLINIPYYWLTITRDASAITGREVFFDTISLLIGLLYLCGVSLNWPSLRKKRAQSADV